MPATKPILAFCIVAVATSLLWAADSSPYEAYVCVEQADVVAGPGHRYYTTDRLPHGKKVEIYREEASGWLAIRPPEGSFSWIPSEFIERLDDEQLGKVKQPTPAWIGTTTEHVGEHHQQVTLKAGELVHIEAEKSITSKGGADRTWLKIAPPAGEFRWIHLRDVSRQKPVDPPSIVEEAVESPVASQREPEPRRLETAGGAIAIRDLRQPTTRIDRAVEPAQYRAATAPPENRSTSPDGFVPRKRRDSDQSNTTPLTTAPNIATSRPRLDPPARIATATPITASPSRVATPLANGLSSDEIARQLDQIEVDLSLMVARDRSEWNLPSIRRLVEALVESGADPVARGRARLTLDKIKQFEDKFHSPAVPTPRSISATSTATERNSSANSLTDPRYDAQGWLKPVISRKGDKPAAPYAVVDSEGQPIMFISPSPGLNLNRYLNKQVGLYGRRGYLEELKRPHLMAERVIEVESNLR